MNGDAAEPTPGATGGLRLDWGADLPARLSTGMPLSVLGQSTLPPPLGFILILARSDGGENGNVSLAAGISLGGNTGSIALASFGLGPLAGALRPPEDLEGHFPTRRLDDATFVLDSQGRDRFAIGPGVMRNQLVVSCGVWPFLAPLLGRRAPALTPRDATMAEIDLAAFCGVVEAVFALLYRRRSVTPPRIVLALRSEGPATESAIERLRRAGRSAAEQVAARVPSSLGGVADEPLEVELADTASFADVGGQEAALRELEAVCLAIREPEVYRRWGARPPKGILLFGPPGTGKTLLARCLAQEAKARFLHVRATDLTTRWYGETERRLQQLFDRARREAPTILFFDEIDALAPSRDGAHEATQRLISTLLEAMDGLEEAQGVVVVAATNRPDAVDPALTRPGRFDRLVEVPLPTREGRQAVFRIHFARAERQAGRPLFPPFAAAAWQRLLDATEGYSGAEVAETVRRVLETKVRQRATEGIVALDDLCEQAATVARPWS